MNPVLRSIGSMSAIAALIASLTLATDSVVISRGDTLGGIAAAHNVSLADLIEWNDIADPDLIVAGSTLIVGSSGESKIDNDSSGSSHYVVSTRDTLTLIARRFHIAVSLLVQLNSIADPDRIFVGQTLRVRSDTDSTPTSESQPVATDQSNTHRIVPGEFLSGIAARFGVRTSELARINGISNPDRIVSGRVLVIPPRDDQQASPAPVAADPTPIEPTPVADEPTPIEPTPVAVEPTPAEPTPSPAPSAVGSTSLSRLFEKWSGVYTVPRGLLEALAWQESNWNPEAVGPSGHMGIAQMSSATVDFVEANLLGKQTDPFDASDGIQLAARYLRYLLDRTPTEHRALAAWVQGLHGVLTDGPSQSAIAFADSVLAIRDARA